MMRQISLLRLFDSKTFLLGKLQNLKWNALITNHYIILLTICMVQAMLDLSKNEKFWAQILKDLTVILNYISSADTR